MRRALAAVVVAAVVLALAVLAGVNSRDSSGDEDETRNTSGDSRTDDDDQRGRSKLDMGKQGDHGPPGWAKQRGPKLDKSLREEWRELSPEERRTLMDKLIREHMGAMREWRRCMEAARDDCELPYPPGLAKLR